MTYARIYILLIICLLTTSCSSFYTFSKYANGRFYTIYQSNGFSACNFKPNFNDCAEEMYFDVKISDDNNKLSIAKFINQSDDISYFGFTRNDYSNQTKPIREFLVWAKSNDSENKEIKMKRPAGNVNGYLFENTVVEYTFKFIHTRAGIPMLIINSGGERYYGITYNNAVKLMQLIDSWHNNTFSGKKIF